MSSDEVRLHRSVSLDQMAEFDSNTGLWHNDGTVEVVRFNEVLPTDDAKHITHIAIPAAEFEAWRRVVQTAVELCRQQLPHRLGDLPDAVRALLSVRKEGHK